MEQVEQIEQPDFGQLRHGKNTCSIAAYLLELLDLRRSVVLVSVLIAGCLLSGWVSADETIPVVASIFPVTDLVRNVGGELVSVTTLLPPGASPHTFDPKPSQVRNVSEARVVFEIGAGLEIWADKLARASGNRDLRIVPLSEGIHLLGPGDGYGRGVRQQATPHANPHIWLDPVHAISMVKRIASVLAEMDRAHETIYFRNAIDYILEILIFHEEARRTIDDFRTKKYVALHPAWAYFANRYGLQPAGIIEESPGKEPTPKHLEKIIAALRRYGIPAVFAEPQLNPKAAEVISKETGAEIVLLDPLGGENIEGRDSYLNLMRYNLSEMKRVLGDRRTE
jgi:zinc transport system substrate-binding protein